MELSLVLTFIVRGGLMSNLPLWLQSFLYTVFGAVVIVIIAVPIIWTAVAIAITDANITVKVIFTVTYFVLAFSVVWALFHTELKNNA